MTLDVLNHATQAWVEMEYNRARHSEIGEAPADRFLRGPDVGRPSPSAEELRGAFRIEMPQIVPAFGQAHAHLAYDAAQDGHGFETIFLRPLLRSARDTSLSADFVLQKA
jgi:hypothetical protein